jgi:hypothetical protein
MSGGAEPVKRVLCRQLCHNPSRKFLGRRKQGVANTQALPIYGSVICMYVYVCICMYVCVHIYICMWVYLSGSVYVYICVYTDYFVFLLFIDKE